MNISNAAIRRNVQVRFDNGRAFNGPKGTTAEAFMLAAAPDTNGRIVGALINGHLRELSEPVNGDARLVPVSMADSDGVRIYRRSLSFLMIAAAAEVFPEETITVHHSMPFGGYYCQRDGGRRLSDAELASLKFRMRELIDANLPITRVQVPLDEALLLFRDNGDFEKADLFAKRRKDYLTLYELNGVRDYFHGFMVPMASFCNFQDVMRLIAYKNLKMNNAWQEYSANMMSGSILWGCLAWRH
jgi:uridine kinase